MRKNEKNNVKSKFGPMKIIGPILVIIVALLFMTGLRILFSWIIPIKLTADENEKALSVEGSNWMSGISDESLLSGITIPGTHDSATENIVFPYSFSCQNTSVGRQLTDGYRFFDLRCRVRESDGAKKVVLYHGSADCHVEKSLNSEALSLSEVCRECYDFLSQNPSECVILMLTERDSAEDDIDTFKNTLYGEINENSCYWYTDNRIPTIGEARGKIVLLLRNEIDGFSEGIVISFSGEDMEYCDRGAVSCEGRFLYQDESSLSVSKKWEAFCKMLEENEPDDESLCLNYLSCSSGFLGLPSPKENARRLNDRLMQYPLQNKDYGVILVDFADEQLAKKIYSANF